MKTLKIVSPDRLREHKILELLQQGSGYSIFDYAKLLGVTSRTVYRALDSLRSQGYPIEKNSGRPRLLTREGTPDDAVYLSDFEAEQLLYLLNTMDQNAPLRTALSGRFGKVLRQTFSPYLMNDESQMQSVSDLCYAMHHGLRVVVKGYRSSHSGMEEDRHVEPFAWSANYRQVYAYDVDKMGVRTFVVSRMAGVEVTSLPWNHRHDHVAPEVDCFWMSGEAREVTLLMSLRALNLLHEEYPLSRSYAVTKSGNAELPYKVTLEVRSEQGIGRFVKGLPQDVVMVDGYWLLK